MQNRLIYILDNVLRFYLIREHLLWEWHPLLPDRLAIMKPVFSVHRVIRQNQPDSKLLEDAASIAGDSPVQVLTKILSLSIRILRYLVSGAQTDEYARPVLLIGLDRLETAFTEIPLDGLRQLVLDVPEELCWLRIFG